jgi:hypothetical protein
MGFEPTIRHYPYNGLANRRLQPLGHPSTDERFTAHARANLVFPADAVNPHRLRRPEPRENARSLGPKLDPRLVQGSLRLSLAPLQRSFDRRSRVGIGGGKLVRIDPQRRGRIGMAEAAG